MAQSPQQTKQISYLKQLRDSGLTKLDMAAVSWLAIGCYLYNGAHAQAVCHLATVVPPAIYSYVLIIDKETSPKGMKSILFFWFLQGMLLVLDSLMGGIKGFHLGKFLVLSGMFWKAMKDNKYRLSDLDKAPATVDLLTSPFELFCGQKQEVFENDWPTESTQGARSHQILKKPDNTRTFVVDNDDTIVEFMASDFTCISPDTSRLMTATSKEFDTLSTCTARSFRLRDLLPRSIKASPSPLRSRLEQNALPGMEFLDASPRLPTFGRFDEFSQGDTQSVMTKLGDLETDPSGFVIIPSAQAKVGLRVTNITAQNAMFGLKCNAMERIKAMPTAGLIRAGETISIRLSLNDNVNWPSVMNERWDKLAIDYLLVDPVDYAQFDRPKFISDAASKHRVKFNVIYRTDVGPAAWPRLL